MKHKIYFVLTTVCLLWICMTACEKETVPETESFAETESFLESSSAPETESETAEIAENDDIKEEQEAMNNTIFSHPLKAADGHLDLSLYTSRHTGDNTIAYKTVNGAEIGMSFYYPPEYDASKTYPTFVFVHGGGWQSEMIFADQEKWSGDYLGFLARYYADNGWLAVSINYRLVQEQGQKEGRGLIEAYEDCADAMTYIVEHAAEYGVDTENIVVLGESAGGHLAGALATFHYEDKPLCRAAVLVNPITELYDSIWNTLVPRQSTHPYLKDLTLEERVEFLSPLYQITEDTCPVLLLHGKADTVVNPAQAEKFHAKMTELGNPCELHWIEDTNHAFLLAEYYADTTAAEIAIGLIDTWLSENILG